MFDGIKIQKKVPVNVRVFLFEEYERNDETLEKKSHYVYVYLAEISQNDTPIFLISKEQLKLGDQELVMKPDGVFDLASLTRKQIDVITTEDLFLKKMVGAEHKTRMDIWNEKRRKDGWTDEIPSYRKVFGEQCEKLGYRVYYISTPVELEELQKLSREEMDMVLEDYIQHGWEVAPEIYAIMRAGIIRFNAEAKNQKLMKYRGHCLIIKPPKTGVSTISQRIGTNLDHLSTKSIEGHANADGVIQHSSLHDEWGHVNIDEFLQMDENLLQHMFNYLELGTFNTCKASRNIRNYGAPRICFTANPMDVNGIDFAKILNEKGTEFTDENGHSTFMRDEGKEKMMYAIYKQSIGQLTKVSNAAFSRLGPIIFTPSLQAAKRTEKAGNVAYFEKVDGIAASLIDLLQAPATDIFLKSEEWLNLPMERYSKQIDECVKQTNQMDIRNAWGGQKEAYRHLRGHALSEAIIDHAYDIILGNYDLKDIQDTAEDNLKYVESMNMDSLNNIVLATKKYEDDNEVFAVRMDNLSPSYVKALLYAYMLAAENREEGEEIDWITLRTTLGLVGKENLDFLGRDKYWSQFEPRMNARKISRCITELFNANAVLLCKYENGKLVNFLTKKSVLVKLQFYFSKKGVKMTI
jgi:hypothetical protein